MTFFSRRYVTLHHDISKYNTNPSWYTFFVPLIRLQLDHVNIRKKNVFRRLL